MLIKETWPTYQGIDKDGVGAIINETGYTSDVKYGRTKLFIRTPMTVFELEKLRAEIVPTLVMLLQRVRRNYLLLIVSAMSSANYISQIPFEIYEKTNGRNFPVSASNHSYISYGVCSYDLNY